MSGHEWARVTTNGIKSKNNWLLLLWHIILSNNNFLAKIYSLHNNAVDKFYPTTIRACGIFTKYLLSLPKVAPNLSSLRLRSQNDDWCVDISKKGVRISRQLSQLLIYSDIFQIVKRWKSTASLNLLVLSGFLWQCPSRRLQLGISHSTKNISTLIKALNHDIFLGLYLTLVPNRRDASNNFYHYTLNSLTVLWLAESVPVTL